MDGAKPIMTDTDKLVLQWIHAELGPVIRTVISALPNTDFSEDWLAAIACRETRNLIWKFGCARGMDAAAAAVHMIGDGGCGYSYWQIDIRSYPQFVKSGTWKNVEQSCIAAINCLSDKAAYLDKNHPKWETVELREDAITAAYNCGQGNVANALRMNVSVDKFTAGGDYSSAVREYRNYYKTLK